MNENSNEPAGWKINDWLRAAGFPFSRPKLYSEINAGRLEACKAGKGTTIILTSPAEYYSKLPRTLAPSPNPKARKRGAE
jgi:hypothetical protein